MKNDVYDYFFDYFSDVREKSKYSYIFIHNVGFSHNKPNYTGGIINRPYFLLHYITAGKGTYTINNQVYQLKACDGFLVPANKPVIYQADKEDPWTVYWVGFSGEMVPSFLDQIKLHNQFVFHYEQDTSIQDTIELLYKNIRDPYCPQETLSGHLLMIIGTLVRSFKTRRTVIPLTPYQQATAFIQRNIYSSLSLQDVLDYVGISASQLYRIFMKEVGVAPYQYILKQKIHRACEMIQNTDMSYSEIARMLGFEYESHFFKLFHSMTNMTPSKYRQYSTSQQNISELFEILGRASETIQ